MSGTDTAVASRCAYAMSGTDIADGGRAVLEREVLALRAQRAAIMLHTPYAMPGADLGPDAVTPWERWMRDAMSRTDRVPDITA
eukprot:3827684-Rhodomonas_salina.2